MFGSSSSVGSTGPLNALSMGDCDKLAAATTEDGTDVVYEVSEAGKTGLAARTPTERRRDNRRRAAKFKQDGEQGKPGCDRDGCRKIEQLLSGLTQKVDRLESSFQSNRTEVEFLRQQLNEHEKKIQTVTRQRDAAKLLNVIERGKLMSLRRNLGLESDDEVSQSGLEGDYKSSSSLEQSSGGSVEWDEGDASECAESEVEKISDTEVSDHEENLPSPVVQDLQVQMGAIRELLANEKLRAAMSAASMVYLQGLCCRAEEACAALAEQFDEQAVAKWVRVLQRANANAIRSNFDACDFHYSQSELGPDVKSIQPAIVWEALPFHERYNLLERIRET